MAFHKEVPMRLSVFKAIAASALAVIAMISAASAADMAPRYTKAPVMAAVYDWTGFYIGGNAGYSWGRSRTDASFFNNTTNVLLATGSTAFDMDGWVAGGQLGYNWQSASWVFGLEGDAQGTGQKGSGGFICAGPICSAANTAIAPLTLAPVAVTFSQKLEWFSTIRGRVGYTFTRTVLGYVTGGAAIGGVNTNGVITGFAANGVASAAAFSGSDTRVGWTVGAGLEASLGGNWTGKIEYLYMDFGKYTTTGVLLLNAPPIRVDLASRVTDNILRVGVNYKFGGPGIAKY
jgi:outer membrane immunogenic protein